jgi:hypothetical protein
MQFKWSGNESAVCTDLLERGNVEGLVRDFTVRVRIEKAEVVEAGVCGVQDAKAILSRLDLKERRDLAVDAVHVAVKLLDPHRMFLRTVDDFRVVKGTVLVK